MKNLTAKRHKDTRSKNENFFVAFRDVSWLNSLPLIAALFCLAFAAEKTFSQTKKPVPKPDVNIVLPTVTQIDAEKLKTLLKPNGKPLLVNFWATWCEPCREEFPDLVKIQADYKDRIDVVTVSLDDLAEIKRDVPKFLAAVKAEKMPAYLLKTPDESAAVESVSKDWQGALPFTIFYNQAGETVYSKQGKFKTETLRAEIEKVLTGEKKVVDALPEVGADLTYDKGKSDAQKDVAAGKLVVKSYGLPSPEWFASAKRLLENYGIETFGYGCVVSGGLIGYVRGYNEISEAAIKKKFGKTSDELLAEK